MKAVIKIKNSSGMKRPNAHGSRKWRIGPKKSSSLIGAGEDEAAARDEEGGEASPRDIRPAQGPCAETIRIKRIWLALLGEH